MNINLKYKNAIGVDQLKNLRTFYEGTTAMANGIVFDVDAVSLKRLDILKHSSENIVFTDVNNNSITLSSSEIPNLIDTLKSNLSLKYVKLHNLYNNLKLDIENVTYKTAVSAFSDID